MQVEYVLKDGVGRYVHRDITGRFSLTTSETLADHYDSRKTAKNILNNCLPMSMRKGFEIFEVVVSEEKAEEPPLEEAPQHIRPKVAEALRIAEQPIAESRVAEFAELFCKVGEVMEQATQRRDELLDALSNVDSEISDINHYIELAEDLNAYQGYLAYRMLRQKLRQRRRIKDEIGVIQMIGSSEIGQEEFDRIGRRIRGMENRIYKPRVLTELFT